MSCLSCHSVHHTKLIQRMSLNLNERSETEVAEILNGMPHYSEALQAKLDSGQICLGGSWAWDESPQWRCLSCKHEWGLTGYALALREIERREGHHK